MAVFIPLSEWATGSDNFFQSLLRRAAFRNASERQFELLARHGKLVLILDGWNEFAWNNMLRPDNLRDELIDAGVVSFVNGRWLVFPDAWQMYVKNNHKPRAE